MPNKGDFRLFIFSSRFHIVKPAGSKGQSARKPHWGVRVTKVGKETPKSGKILHHTVSKKDHLPCYWLFCFAFECGNFTFSISVTAQHSLLHFQLLRLTCAQGQHHAVHGKVIGIEIRVSVDVLVVKGKGKPAHKGPR